jgi:hypothetical protein
MLFRLPDVAVQKQSSGLPQRVVSILAFSERASNSAENFTSNSVENDTFGNFPFGRQQRGSRNPRSPDALAFWRRYSA